MSYQSFHSKPHEKWEKLLLKEEDYKDKRVLDLGCNEGWFCKKVASLAKEVIGVDKDIKVLPENSGNMEFCNEDWKFYLNTTDKKFDLIFWMAALHYDCDPEQTFELIHKRLSDDGLLVLDTGVVIDNYYIPHLIYRSNHWVRYPTTPLLYSRWLKGYTKRHVGISGIHDGIERSIIHCRKKQPTAFLVGGSSCEGKTNASGLFNTDIFNLDKHFTEQRKYNLKYLPFLSKTFKEIEMEHSKEFIDTILNCIYAHDIVLEGVVVNFKNMREHLINGLKAKGFRIWEVDKIG